MSEAEDATATDTGAALEQVDASTAFVAIGGHLRVAKDAEFRHGRGEGRSAPVARAVAVLPSGGRHHTHERAEIRLAHVLGC